MPEVLLYLFGMRSLCDEQGRTRVAQVVKSEAGVEARARDRWLVVAPVEIAAP
jgi:hypothetical protein